jgi:hypothetical protein
LLEGFGITQESKVSREGREGGPVQISEAKILAQELNPCYSVKHPYFGSYGKMVESKNNAD